MFAQANEPIAAATQVAIESVYLYTYILVYIYINIYKKIFFLARFLKFFFQNIKNGMRVVKTIRIVSFSRLL